MQLVFPGLDTNIIDINTHILTEFCCYILIDENVNNSFIFNVTTLTNQVRHNIDMYYSYVLVGSRPCAQS